MAITLCHYCNAPTNGQQCPRCGRPTPQASMRRARVIVLLVMLLGTIVFAAFVAYAMTAYR